MYEVMTTDRLDLLKYVADADSRHETITILFLDFFLFFHFFSFFEFVLIFFFMEFFYQIFSFFFSFFYLRFFSFSFFLFFLLTFLFIFYSSLHSDRSKITRRSINQSFRVCKVNFTFLKVVINLLSKLEIINS